MDEYQSAPWLSRQALLIGEENCRKLAGASVAIIGLGGVGGAAAEGLARAGVGKLILVDHDRVDLTNLNRQLIATRDTIGMAKTEAAAARIRQINPDCTLRLLPIFYGADTAEALFAEKPDYVLDCIDTVTAKLHLAEQCRERQIPLLISLGTGNRLDPSSFRIGDIAETAACGSGDGLARVMRKELKKRGIHQARVLYSVEPAAKTVLPNGAGRYAPGSISFCPPAAGFLLASRVVRDLIGQK